MRFAEVGLALLEKVCHCSGGLCGPIFSSYVLCRDSTLPVACGTRCRTLSSFSSIMSAYMLMP